MAAKWSRWWSSWKLLVSGQRGRTPRRRPARWHHCRLEILETRMAPAFFGGASVAAGDVLKTGATDIVTGAGPGGAPHVQVFSGLDGSTIRSFFAYDASFTGGVSVAVGDVDGDGDGDIVTGAGPGGGPHVKVFNGTTGALVSSFFAYDPSFHGGVTVAVADVEGNGHPDIITGTSTGAAHVKVFNGMTGAVVDSFFAYDPSYSGGVSVAGADVEGIRRADIITGASHGAAHVKVFNSSTLAVVNSFFAYDPSYSGGVNVAAGDVEGIGRADIVTGAAKGVAHVKVFNSASGAAVRSFFAYDPSFLVGANVATMDFNGDGKSDLLTGTEPGGVAQISVFNAVDLQPITSFIAYDPFSPPAGGFSQGVKQPTFDLDPASDTGPKGDQRTAMDVVTLVGQSSPGATVNLQPNNLSTTADNTGRFTFTGVRLVSGPNTFTAIASDTKGHQSQFVQTIIRDRPPTVSTPIGPLTAGRNDGTKTLDLSKFFTDPDVVDTVVRINTTSGPVDVELFDQKAPLSVANFLNYVNSSRYSSTIFHRSVKSPSIVQGGGFVFRDGPSRLDPVQVDSPVVNEFDKSRSNVRGTLAFAKTSDPNSATSQFYFNVGDNSTALDDPRNSGGFTVFGMIQPASLAVLDALAAIATQNKGATFSDIPLMNYNGTNFPTDAARSNFTLVNSVSYLRHSDQLTFSVLNNTNTAAVTTSVSGNTLSLTYTGTAGTATITVRATDQDGLFVDTTFTVTVT